VASTTFHINRGEPGAPRVLLIYTGGTVGMVGGRDGLEPLDFGSLVDHLPALASLRLDLCAESLQPPIDSAEATPQLWTWIATLIEERYEAHDAFVVLHGTDTMAYTASALSFMLEGLGKPVIVTGGQRALSQVRSDARENLVSAIAIAAHQRVREVSVFFDRVLLRGNRTTKIAVDRFDAFASPNHPPLARAGVEISYHGAIAPPERAGSLRVATRFHPGVTSLRLFPGIGRAAIEAVLALPDLAGFVLAVYGAGNAPSTAWLQEGLAAAVQRGVVAVCVTQCLSGSVTPGRYASGAGLSRAGVLSGADMTFEAAVTKLMLLLGEHGAHAARELIGVPLAGELTLR
jgi:L-asparaginase